MFTDLLLDSNKRLEHRLKPCIRLLRGCYTTREGYIQTLYVDVTLNVTLTLTLEVGLIMSDSNKPQTTLSTL